MPISRTCALLVLRGGGVVAPGRATPDLVRDHVGHDAADDPAGGAESPGDQHLLQAELLCALGSYRVVSALHPLERLEFHGVSSWLYTPSVEGHVPYTIFLYQNTRVILCFRGVQDTPR
jgi:hypothetical protein